MGYLGTKPSNQTPTYKLKSEFVATAGQTVFAPSAYTPGYIDVYRNGVKLGNADFTATNGTTVTLAQGATAGDLITFESVYLASIQNGIPATAGAVSTGYLADASVTQAKLGTNVAGNGPAFSAYQSAAQTVSNATATKITFTSSDFDTTGGMFASSRFTPTVSGYYLIASGITFGGNSSNIYTWVSVYKNGTAFKRTTAYNGYAGGPSIGALVYLNGSTDYVEIYGQQASGVNMNMTTGTDATYFQATLVRSA